VAERPNLAPKARTSALVERQSVADYGIVAAKASSSAMMGVKSLTPLAFASSLRTFPTKLKTLT